VGVALLAAPPLMASPDDASGGRVALSTRAPVAAAAPATRTGPRPLLPPEIARIQREARQQAVDLRRELLAYEEEVRRREAEDSWNEWLRYKLADTLGRLWSAGRDLERSLAEAPLDLEHQSAAVRRWQPTLDRLRVLDGRLRQRDAERRAGGLTAAPLVVLPPGTGGLSGRVTDALTELGVDGWVELYDADGNWVDFAHTDAAGGYAFAPSPRGGYHVKTSSYGTAYLDELYDDIPCPASCDVTSGTVVSVTAGALTTGVDFVLDRGGIVSGRITAADSGLGVPTHVYLVDASGGYAGSGYSDSSGRYHSDGLLPGSCYAVAERSGPYLWQLYQGRPCASGTCDATTGTPIAVVKNEVTNGIDFSLPRGGQIGGQVLDQVSGVVLDNVQVTIVDAGGAWVAQEQTNASGEYRSQIGLETGTYFAVANPPPPHLPELFQDLPCFDGLCDPTGGTAIAVVAGATTSGVDFGLPRGGGITGRVTDATTGGGVAAHVSVFDAQGRSAAWSYADAAGLYEVVGLPPGSYFVRADPTWPYLDEVFDDVPCYDGGCDPTTGTPVPVALGTTTTGIDLSVPRGGSVSGTVVDETSGVPVADAYVTILDANGGWLGSALTNVLGSYAVSGLVPGNVFVTVTNAGPYWPELYDGVPCPDPFWCSVLPGGTPVPVPLGGAVAGIDFALGTVSAAASEFFTVDPCRAVDTRGADGPALAAGTERVFNVTGYAGSCMGLYGARAVSLNVAVVGADAPGNVRLYAAGSPVPATSTLNYAAGVTRSNNAVVSLNAEGQLAVYVGQASGQVHLIIDIYGDFE
jgi:hypothetical protein